jgi:hypothetical protein
MYKYIELFYNIQNYYDHKIIIRVCRDCTMVFKYIK